LTALFLWVNSHRDHRDHGGDTLFPLWSLWPLWQKLFKHLKTAIVTFGIRPRRGGLIDVTSVRSGYLHYNKGQVIILRSARDPFFNTAHHLIADLVYRKLSGCGQSFLDSLLIELFALSIVGLRQTVREGDQHVARLHLHDLLLVAAMLEHPDEHPARAE